MPNEKAVVPVLGVLVDPVWSCKETFECDGFVHDIVPSLWATLVNKVDKDSTPKITDRPSDRKSVV